MCHDRRSYAARPIFSTDEPSGSRFKMERFLHPGRQTVLSVYGPICFGPLPVLAFLRAPDGSLRLAASGAPPIPALSLVRCEKVCRAAMSLAWRHPLALGPSD